MGTRLLPMGAAARFAPPATNADATSKLIVAVAPVVRGALAPDGPLPLVTADTEHPAVAGDIPEAAVVVEVDDPALGAAAAMAAITEHTAAHGVPELIVIPGRVAFTAKAAGGSGPVAGKIAVVTGGAHSLGLGLARELLGAGAYVAVADSTGGRSPESTQSLAEEFGADRVMALGVDVADENSQRAMVAAVVARWGGVDLFVATASVLGADGVMALPVADFDLITDLNYRGYFLGTRAVAPIMAAQHEARPDLLFDIVEINTSGLALAGRGLLHAGSRLGGVGLTQAFALELAERGIKVNAVCPGTYLDGPLWSDPEHGLLAGHLEAGTVPGAHTVDDVRRHFEQQIPLGRGVLPADVAVAVQYLVAQQHETGQMLTVTGGATMRA